VDLAGKLLQERRGDSVSQSGAGHCRICGRAMRAVCLWRWLQ